MIQVSFGGGTNSTAMLIGLRNDGIMPDVILFADTGSEMPETYEHLAVMQQWCKDNEFPEITVVRYYPRKLEGEPQSLYQECIDGKKLPSIAYGGFKTCSQKYKIYTQEKFMKANEMYQETIANYERVIRYIGYDAGEPQRRDNARKFDRVNKEYENIYPMVDDWNWDRAKCVEVILNEGLKLPGKSSCFFCPNMKKSEIIALHKNHKDLFDKAVAMEQNADLTTVKGLGRQWSWEVFMTQLNLFDIIDGQFEEDEEIGIPCGCYD